MLVASSSSFDLRSKGFFWYNGVVHDAFRVQFPTGASRNVVAVKWQAFVHEIEHYVDPRLDLISATYGK